MGAMLNAIHRRQVFSSSIDFAQHCPPEFDGGLLHRGVMKCARKAVAESAAVIAG